jgi:predicted acyl esterase
MQCAPALDRITALEQYRTLSGRGVPARLLVGPWTHLEIGSQGGAAMTESLAWLGRYAGPGRPASRAPARSPAPGQDRAVRIWVGGEGAGEWRETGTWPPPGAAAQRWYLGAHGSLSLAAAGPQVPPAAGFRVPVRPGRPYAVPGRRDPVRAGREP